MKRKLTTKNIFKLYVNQLFFYLQTKKYNVKKQFVQVSLTTTLQLLVHNGQ